MSTIIDEIKKLNQYMNFNDEITVKLSDTEEVLAKCTCENCKHFHSAFGIKVCNNILSDVNNIWTENNFGCNQWQSKEEKEG